MSSPAAGTVLLFQLVPVFQSVEVLPVHVLAASVNVVLASRPDFNPVAVTENFPPTPYWAGLNDVFVIVPFASATDVSTSSSCTKGSRCRTMVTVSCGSQPWPVRVTVRPGG